ncbi:hypothetical protein SD71_09730 [Cohnella kolymensis]|uniref:Uncharacterized protein n=1 Tax=Cohnella kolymensis TaxID=1590652 RepID=A0ABR5A5E7_9BACL|nr:hypothetical protein [Cohnella kolymensis]KIL36216.1 hypothetical protein SD71_09730 [Cohnella kolymensis]
MNQRILNAIGETLLVKGNCPFDTGCRFGSGNLCSASDDTLAKKIQALKEKINDSPQSLAVDVTVNPSKWHCENVLSVQFIDTDDIGLMTE